MTRPRRGTSFPLSSAFVEIYMQNWPKIHHKSCSPLCGILLPFLPTFAHINGRDGARGATAPLACPLRAFCRTTAFSSIFTRKTGLNCSQMLLPTHSGISSRLLSCAILKIVLRFCVEGQAWVRVGVSRAVKASLRLYLKLQVQSQQSTVTAKQQVWSQRSAKYRCSKESSKVAASSVRSLVRFHHTQTLE